MTGHSIDKRLQYNFTPRNFAQCETTGAAEMLLTDTQQHQLSIVRHYANAGLTKAAARSAAALHRAAVSRHQQQLIHAVAVELRINSHQDYITTEQGA